MTMDTEERATTKSRFPIIGSAIIDLAEKVFVPEKEFPEHNFLGSIIGPKGSTMKHLATTTKCRISVLGRHSMRDRETEDKLLESTEPQHQHLKEPLHVLINIKAPAHIAYARMTNAIKQINKFMVPISSPATSPVVGGGGGAPILHYGIPPPGAIIIGQPGVPITQQLKKTLNMTPVSTSSRGGAELSQRSNARESEGAYSKESGHYDRMYDSYTSFNNEDSYDDQCDGNYKRSRSRGGAGYSDGSYNNSSGSRSNIMDNYYG